MKIIYKRAEDSYNGIVEAFCLTDPSHYKFFPYKISELLYLKVKDYYLKNNIDFKTFVPGNKLKNVLEQDFVISNKIIQILGK